MKESTLRVHSMSFYVDSEASMLMLEAACEGLRRHNTCYAIETGAEHCGHPTVILSWFVQRLIHDKRRRS